MLRRLLLSTSLAACIAGCGGGSTKNSTAKPSRAGVIPAHELYVNFKADPAAAEAKYSGRTLTVSGTAHSRTEDGASKKLHIFVYGEGTEVFDVTCTSDDTQWASESEGVRSSHLVTFMGTFRAFDPRTKNIDFNDCRLAPKQ